MVTAQEEMIQRIDSDLDDTLDNTKKAQDRLSFQMPVVTNIPVSAVLIRTTCLSISTTYPRTVPDLHEDRLRHVVAVALAPRCSHHQGLPDSDIFRNFLCGVSGMNYCQVLPMYWWQWGIATSCGMEYSYFKLKTRTPTRQVISKSSDRARKGQHCSVLLQLGSAWLVQWPCASFCSRR